MTIASHFKILAKRDVQCKVVLDTQAVILPVDGEKEAMVSSAVSLHVDMVDNDLLSPRQIASAYQAYARIYTGVLMPLPTLPYSYDHDVSNLVHFMSALRGAATIIACPSHTMTVTLECR